MSAFSLGYPLDSIAAGEVLDSELPPEILAQFETKSSILLDMSGLGLCV